MLLEQADTAKKQYGLASRGTLCVALVGVMGYGNIIDSSADFEDPPTTWRVSNYSITGPILLPHTGQGRAVKPLLRRFGKRWDIEYVPSLVDDSHEDVDDVIAATQAADD